MYKTAALPDKKFKIGKFKKTKMQIFSFSPHLNEKKVVQNPDFVLKSLPTSFDTLKGQKNNCPLSSPHMALGE